MDVTTSEPRVFKRHPGRSSPMYGEWPKIHEMVGIYRANQDFKERDEALGFGVVRSG